MARKTDDGSEKVRYRVTNWREYNAALVKRGSVTLWLDEAVIEEWHAVSGKGMRYSDSAITCALSLRLVFGLALRQTEGFLNSLAKALKLKVRIPDYTTLSRRAPGLTIPPVPNLHPGEPVHLAVDATGLKVFGEGEWLVRTHGASQRRVWRKLHLGVDATTGEIVTHSLTLSNRAEGRELPALLEHVDDKTLEAVYGDKGYDSFACHKTVLASGAKPVLLTRRGASTGPPAGMKKKNKPPPTRGKIVKRMHEIGRKGWKIESGYHRRSLSETAMYRYKTVIGPKMRARRLDSQKTEAATAVRILNRFTALGMPETVQIV